MGFTFVQRKKKEKKERRSINLYPHWLICLSAFSKGLLLFLLWIFCLIKIRLTWQNYITQFPFSSFQICQPPLCVRSPTSNLHNNNQIWKRVIPFSPSEDGMISTPTYYVRFSVLSTTSVMQPQLLLRFVAAPFVLLGVRFYVILSSGMF